MIIFFEKALLGNKNEVHVNFVQDGLNGSQKQVENWSPVKAAMQWLEWEA